MQKLMLKKMLYFQMQPQLPKFGGMKFSFVLYFPHIHTFQNSIFHTNIRIFSVLQLRTKLFTQWEIAQIASLLPQTSAMAKALIPSISEREIDDMLLQDILNDIIAVCISLQLAQLPK